MSMRVFKRFFEYFTLRKPVLRDATQDQAYWDAISLQDLRLARSKYMEQNPKYPLLPDRYKNEVPPINVLIERMSIEHLKDDAFHVLLWSTPVQLHEWLKKSWVEDGNRVIRICKGKTSEETLRNISKFSERYIRESQDEGSEANGSKLEYKPSDGAFRKLWL